MNVLSRPVGIIETVAMSRLLIVEFLTKRRELLAEFGELRVRGGRFGRGFVLGGAEWDGDDGDTNGQEQP